MTDKVLTADTFTTLPWYNSLSDPQNFYNNGAYEVKERTNHGYEDFTEVAIPKK
jgi:hypothetical protein